jgi:hypothetical protein
MHTAYLSEVAVEELPMMIECLEAHGDTILAGTKDGTLVVVGRDPEGDSANSFGQWHLLDAHKLFAKRPILQLKAFHGAAKAENGGGGADSSATLVHLASLTDEGVCFHVLQAGTASEFTLAETVWKTRGAHMFAWQEEHSMLAVAVKRCARSHFTHPQ